ncbi:hypothetical protein C8J56DRAFT_1096723 [Mycena floridula]|nr:hypothetical protein C8J56DRAFT_1096723 [Mycena floridula]
MPRARYPAFAFLWLAAASLGKLTLNPPDHIIIEQQTVIPWTRDGAHDPSEFGIRTVPSTTIQVGNPQPDGSAGLSGTILVVFEESFAGILDTSNPNLVYTTSSPFNVFILGGSTGSEGAAESSSVSGPGTSDPFAISTTSLRGASLSSTAKPASDSIPLGISTVPGSPTSSPIRATTSSQIAAATGLSQTATFIGSSETGSLQTGLPGPDSTTPDSSSRSDSGSNHHSPAGVIAGAVFGSLALLGLLAGIPLWLRRQKWQFKALSTDPFSSTVELRSIPNEKLLPSSRPSSPNLGRQDLSFPSMTKPRLASPVAVQSSQILVQNTTQTRNNEVQNLGPEERNLSIEEMAAEMQRMGSEIVRLNQHLLPPAYSCPPSTQ